MIKPSFINNTLLTKVKLTTTDLEKEILGLGLNIESYGVIDQNTNKLYLIVQDDRECLQKKIREYLLNEPAEEQVEIFWSNLNKYSILCEIKFVLQNLDNIFDEDWDFWIVNNRKKWIIENYHEERLSIFNLN
ncbi:hypothetical protein [Acinetobacter gerneri]|uniref:hypothetical protein n=1 Tax=Acinetobacter gerneri TaxID=202952 RepID=UPI003A87B04E